MAVILKSNMPYLGNLADLPPPNAPMPVDADFYADFIGDLFITADQRAATSAVIFHHAALRERYVRNAAGGYTLYPAGTGGRRAHGETGQRLGMLLEAGNSQRIATSMRQLLTAAAPTGVTVAAGPATANAWDRWYSLTPTGDGQHDLRFTSDSEVSTNSRRTFAIEFKSGGQRYVQLSSGTEGDATDYANFDLLNKTVVSQPAGAAFAGVVPTIDGCICFIQYASSYAGIEYPTVSLISDPSATKMPSAPSASLVTVSARLPKLRTASGVRTRIPAASAMPGATNSVLADRLTLQPALIRGSYTYVIDALTSPWINTWSATLFSAAIGQSSTNAVQVRQISAGQYGVISRISNSDTVVHTFQTAFTPNSRLVFGVAKEGNTLRIALNGETFQGEFTQLTDTQPFILTGPVNDDHGFEGYLRRMIGWSQPRTVSQLAALVEDYS